MSSPDSDGAAEMLEGGVRAVSTGTMRLVETMQRRQQGTARHNTQQLQRSTTQIEHHIEALTAVDNLTKTAPRSSDHQTPSAKADARQQITETSSTEPPPAAQQLFPSMSLETAQAAVNDLTARGDLPAYLHGDIWATREAIRSGRIPGPAELHRRAIELFPTVRDEQAAADRDRAEARELDKLRQQLAVDDAAHQPGRENSETRPLRLSGGTEDAAAIDNLHDSANARESRAAGLWEQGYDTDTTQAALLHDLSFGAPAQAAVQAPKGAASQKAKPRAVKRIPNRSRQMSR